MKIIGRIPPVLVYILMSLSTLTETMYSAALPNITENLKTHGSIAQLSTSAYYCGFAIGIFTLGRVSDVLGRRPVVLFGMVFYSLASLLISYSQNIEVFIVCRFLQAYGASVGSVVGQAMSRDSYKGWELSYLYSGIAMIMAVIPSLGASMGGYIVQYADWQSVFRFLTFLGFSLCLLYLKFLPETNPYIGVAKNNRFSTVLKTAINDKVLMGYAFIVGAFNGICFGFYIQAPFILIDSRGMSPSDYGKLFLFLSVANLTGSLLSRKLIKKFISTFKIKITGFVFSIFGCFSLLAGAFITNNESSTLSVSLWIFIPMAIHMVGHSLLIPMILRHALEDYYKVTGSAGAIFGFSYYIITAIVSYLISYLYSQTMNNFAFLTCFLILSCLVLFKYTINWRKKMIPPEFT